MQKEAFSLTKLKDNEIKVLKDISATQSTNNKTIEKEKGYNLRKNDVKRDVYNFLFRNCSEDVAKIAEAGGLTVKNELVPKAMTILTKETFLQYSDELLW